MKITKSFWVGAALAVLSAPAMYAGTFPASTCNEPDVAKAISQATGAGSGNTVTIPAGSCTWTTALTVSLPSSLSIIGAGNSSVGGGDSTVLIDNVNHSSTDYMVYIDTGAPSNSFRWSGITIKADGNSNTSNNGVFAIGGTSQAIRVDHSHWIQNQQLEVGVAGQVYGVFDHDLFDQGDLGLRTLATSWDSSTPGAGDQYGDGSWNDVTSLGSNRFVFVEDSTFNSTSTGTATPSNDCLSGGRFVFRYNTFTGGGALQTHPTGHAGDDRGCRAWEIYNNTFKNNTVSSNPEYNMFFLSSGTGVIWGNSVTSYQSFVTTHSMLADKATYQQSAPPNGWGYCGTSVNGSSSPWNQNSDSTTGYACLDQPGRGKGDLLSGTFPNKCDKTTGCTTYNGTWPHEALEPIYEWMDSWVGAPGYPGSFWSINDPEFTQNQDYYLWCNSASPSGCSSFNGTQGVGSGPLSSRPSSCTTGVAYWATDQGNWNKSGNGGQGELYLCSATNTWSLFYTPYQYPHPLVTGSSSTPPPCPALPPIFPERFTEPVPPSPKFPGVIAHRLFRPDPGTGDATIPG